MTATIHSFTGRYRFLSNFFPSPIAWGGAEWPTVEHAYQASKCVRQDEATAILNAPTPSVAKRIGNRAKLRTDWDDVRVPVMYELLRLKFAPGSALACELLATGNAVLVEGNTWGDKFWGVCNGEGRNMLGVLLMGLRDELRKSCQRAAVRYT